MKQILKKGLRRLKNLASDDTGPQHRPVPPAEQQVVRLFPGIGAHHNILEVGNFLAAMSSAQFAIDKFATARPFPNKNHVYGWAMEQCPSDGLVMEFGVASGGTVNQLATHHKGPVYGFDVFTGLPETWRPGFPEGAFAQPELPKVKRNVELVVGLFDDTLPGFVETHPGRVKLLHVDCDIYSGTVTIFNELEDRIDDDTIIVFDEYLNYPGWEGGEHKAFMEFCERTGREPEYLAFVPASEQVVARAIRTDGTGASKKNSDDSGHRQVNHVSFEQLGASGYHVITREDGAKPLRLKKADMPENWARPQPMITPAAVTLPGATLFQDGSALMKDGRYIYYDATFNIEPWRSRHVRAVMQSIDPETDDALIKPHPRTQQVSGRAFSALTNTAHNYGHFIHDVLSRIHYEDLGLIAPGRDRIIAPGFRFPMMQRLFETIFEGYEIVTVSQGCALEVEELILPRNLCSSTRFNPAGITALQTRLRTAFADYAGGDAHKICVSRRDGKDTGGRAFVNVAAYEEMMAEHGYEVVEVSKMDVEAQLKLWCNTTHIAGIHGAGLMNMILMPPKGSYLEIAGAPRGPNYTARCAAAAGHRVLGMAGTLDQADQAQIDLKDLARRLKAAQ